MRPEHWLFTIPLRLRSLFRSAQADEELDDELRDHLERRTEEYVGKGMESEEARRQARLDQGGIEQTKEKCRDARHVSWIQDFVQDLRYGLRRIRSFVTLESIDPGFNPHGVLSMIVPVAGSSEADPGRRAIFYRQMLERNRDF